MLDCEHMSNVGGPTTYSEAVLQKAQEGRRGSTASGFIARNELERLINSTFVA